MTSPDRDYDDVLRRALHAMADPIEPAGDGLARIRSQIEGPWLRRQSRLWVTDCIDLVMLLFVRSEPFFTWVREASSLGAKTVGTWLAAFAQAARSGAATMAHTARGALGATTKPAATGLARLRSREAISGFFPEEGGPVSPQRRSAARRVVPRARLYRPSMGSTLAWLRPALAVTSVVVVVAAGALGYARLQQTINPSGFGIGRGGQNPGHGGGAPAASDSRGGQALGGRKSHNPARVGAGKKTRAGVTPQGTGGCPSPSTAPSTLPSPSTSPPLSPTPTASPTPPASPTPTPTISATTPSSGQTPTPTAASGVAPGHPRAMSNVCPSPTSAPPGSTGPTPPTSGFGSVTQSVGTEAEPAAGRHAR